jgi:small subunit ribosomal protein S7
MPRRREVAKREVPPDPMYNSTLVTKFVRCIMKSGKWSTAEGILYGSLDIIRERTGDDPLKVFNKALDNVKPSLEVKSRRVGGANYRCPLRSTPTAGCH